MERRESEDRMKRAAERAGRQVGKARDKKGRERSPRRDGRAGSRKAKRPFEIDEAIRLLREAVRPFPAAAMFALKEAGYGTLFQQLVACVISIRTLDEVSLPVSMRLLERAPTAEVMVTLTVGEIDGLIRGATFHGPKARTIREIARVTVEKFGGELPCEREVLEGLSGVGPKCASLALGVACGQAHISVDVHVHRVVNRWGWLGEEIKTPAKMMGALMQVLPEEYWVELNRLLVPFGEHVCTGVRPRCSECPLLAMCQQRGVREMR